ncbi:MULTISPECIES: hypothetical protein [unclassified Curtobacterium]|uniref:hypothetical protein n=1 Tax=unclassified Curtobacterium TaxID=257496 RepID=UPI00380449FB
MSRDRQPLREHGFRVVTMVIGMVVGLAAAFFIVPAITGRENRGPFWAYGLGFALAILIGGGALVLGLAIGQRIVGDRIEAAVREPGAKWRHGRFTFVPGGVTFERYRWQLRIPSGKKTTFTGVRLGEDTGRRPPWRHLWTINPQLHIVTLDSEQGRYEVAAMPSRLRAFERRLSEPQLDPH